MKRYEKNLQTRNKIIDSALNEFSAKSYGEASLNTICSANNISKGIIYHYFDDKDKLYLACVKECFDGLTSYLNEFVITDNLPIAQAMECYFDARLTFFKEHPTYLGIFCSAVMNTPLHLASQITDISSNFNNQAVSILTSLLKKTSLRPDVTMSQVIEIFCEYQDFVHARFQMKASKEATLKEHEERCRRCLHVLLYGVIEREAAL